MDMWSVQCFQILFKHTFYDTNLSWSFFFPLPAMTFKVTVDSLWGYCIFIETQ